MRDYTLRRVPRQPATGSKIVGPKPQNLRRGGGRKDSPGWTEQKRKANRHRFDELRPYLKTGVTVWCPSRAAGEQIQKINECCRNFCKEKGLPARAVWEGPNPHTHIALGLAWNEALEAQWLSRLAKAWPKVFGEVMPANAFLWQREEKPEQIASYFSKTRNRRNIVVKGNGPAFAWLTFCPTWETGCRELLKSCAEANTATSVIPATPRKKEVNLDSHVPPEKEGDVLFPHYTPKNPEKESETSIAESWLSLADLWEASPMRFEKETLGDILPSLPASMHRFFYPLNDEPKAVARALGLSQARTLIAAYTEQKSNTLVCLTYPNLKMGELVEIHHLQHHANCPVYFQWWG